MFITVD